MIQSKLYYLIFIFLIFFKCNSISSFAQSNTYLSIESVIDQTLESCPAIAISKKNIVIASGLVKVSLNPFDPKFSIQTSKDIIVMPNNLYQRLKGNSYSKTDNLSYSIDYKQKFRYGTTINPSIQFVNYGKDSLFNTDNPLYTGLYANRTNASLTIIQPILNGFGKKFNTFEEEVSQIQYRISELSYYEDVSASIYQSLTAYLEYIYANKVALIQKETEQWLINLDNQIAYLVKMDALPKADQKYVSALIASRLAYKEESELNLLIRKKELGKAMGISIEKVKLLPLPPEDFYTKSITSFDTSGYLKMSIEKSISSKNDIKKYQAELEKAELEEKYSRLNLKQEFNITFNIGYNGIFESREFDQLYKPYYENIYGFNYFVGISYTLDPRNQKKKGELMKSIANKEIAETKMDLLINNTKLEIDNCFRKIITYNKIAKNLKTAVDYNKEALDNEYTKLKLGTTTLINLIQLQINYYETFLDYYTSLLNLNSSLLSYRYMTGTLINVSNESIVKIDREKLFTLPFN